MGSDGKIFTFPRTLTIKYVTYSPIHYKWCTVGGARGVCIIKQNENNNMYNNLIFTSTIGENYMIICNKGQSFEYREVIKYGQAWSNLSQSPYSLDMQ